MEKRSKFPFRKLFLGVLLGLLGVCVLLFGASALINRGLPQHLAVDDRLTATDKARIAEAAHLRATVGDQIMPGFGSADIPMIIYNENYAFLVGLDDPAVGWNKVPQRTRMGTDWEKVAGEDYFGKPYFRQRLANAKAGPQAFTVLIGDQYASSMPIQEWMKISLVTDLREGVPEVVKPVVPYFLMTSLLLPNSDVYITALDHESMHAYQGMRASQRLDAAETAASKAKSRYPYDDTVFIADWQNELNLLNEAVRAQTDSEARDLARKFLDLRTSRRQKARLAADLVDFERLKEWEEGIAKYTELSAYRLASDAERYQPIAEIGQDPQFKSFKGFQKKWDQEVYQIRLEANVEADMRFYYTGFAQAVLLDRLGSGWKERLFDDGVWLEDLLSEAVK